MLVRELAMTGHGRAIPLAASGHGSSRFSPTARGRREEAGEPGVRCERVWRRLLSPRLLLSLERLQLWRLL